MNYNYYTEEKLNSVLEHIRSFYPLKDSMGRFLTQSLVKEMMYNSNKDQSKVIFTLKDDDDYINIVNKISGLKEPREVYSLRKLFLTFKDPTEYEFSNNVFGSFNHWKLIRDLVWCKEHYESWKEELNILLESEGFKLIQKAAREGSPQASRWLAERGWSKDSNDNKKNKRKVGRPPSTIDADIVEFENNNLQSEVRDDLGRLQKIN